MRPVAAAVAITLLVVTGLLFAGPGTGLAAPASDAAGPLRLDLTTMSPRIVTARGPAVLTITGTVTNTGADPVDNLEIRAQRGLPLDTEGQLRGALDGTAGTDAVTPDFQPVTGTLEPGQQAPVRLSMPLEGGPGATVALTGPGVYELIVNVNGVPRGGARARLAATRLLLPVLALPSTAAPATTPPVGRQGAPFALLYPITDTPRRLSTVPGEQPLLVDDSLAASFAPNGRLGGLVAALAELAPTGSRVRTATCLAVDPDLVETADAIRQGYLFLGPDGVPRPGTGAAAAGAWLDQLRAVARGGCVVALPYADADLVALTRGGLPDLARTAIADGRQVLSALLRTPVVPGVTWPAGGLTDPTTLDVAGSAGGNALILSSDGLDQGRTRSSTGVVPIAGGRSGRFAVLADPLLTLAAAGPTASTLTDTVDPDVGRGTAAVAGAVAGTDTPLSTQDVIGTLVFRATAPRSGDGPLVLAPPHRWAAEGAGARALLGTVAELLDAGSITARGLDSVLAAGPAPGSAAHPLVYPLTAAADEIPTSVIDTVRATALDLTDLHSAVVTGSGVGIGESDVFAPLTAGLVRPASAALRGRSADSAAVAAAGATRIDDLRAEVRVLEPPSPYSLGTSNAPLPITVANGLPLTVRVRVEIASTSGLRVAPIAPVEVPPLGRRQVSVNVQVTRSGQFTVDASVLTPDGGLLGPPSRLRVQSTAYGTITVWLTIGAGVLLVVLAVRRVWRRIRGDRGRGPDPNPADPNPADPNPHDQIPGNRTTSTGTTSDQTTSAATPDSAAPTGPVEQNPTQDAPIPVSPDEAALPAPAIPALLDQALLTGPLPTLPPRRAAAPGLPHPAARPSVARPLVPAGEDAHPADRLPTNPPPSPSP